MIVAVVGEKGGTGKSTIATNLAAMRASQGRDVLLIDTDTQLSSSSWQATRSENPELVKVNCISKFGKTLATEINDLRVRYQDLILDAGGRDSIEMRACLLKADVALLPVQASQFDLWTIQKMHQLFAEASAMNESLAVLAVVNQAVGANSAELAAAQEILREFDGINLAGVALKKRVSYMRAAAAGMSVVEYEADPDGKASFEITQLFKEIFGDK